MPLKRKIVFYLISGIVLLSAVWFVVRFKGKLTQILMPFFIAMIIAYLLNPIVQRMERKKIKRMYAILLIYVFAAMVLTFAVIFMLPELVSNTRELINTIPQISSQFQSLFNRFMTSIQTSNWPPDVKNTITREIHNGTVMAQNYVMDTLKRSLVSLIETVTMFFDIMLSMIIAYYFIKDAEFFKAVALSITPRRWRNGIIKTGREIHLILSHFIQGQLITAFIVGAMEVVALMIVKVKYPFILGFIGGIANVIPYFGPFIGSIPAIAVGLIQSPLKALLAATAFAVVQQIDNAFISPKIIEGKLGLHPVSTILAVLIGGEFFGIIGMLVSVPVMAILKVMLKNAVEAIV